jgi:hypothetical protein
MMPSQNLYRQHTDTELTSASSTAEEDLERKIDEITTHQKHTLRVFSLGLARARLLR